MPTRFSRSASEATARRTYELLDEPVGDDYRSLLQVATIECASAVLTVPHDIDDRGVAVVEELTAVAGESTPGATRLRLRYDTRTAAVLGRVAESLYGWRPPQLPESLCLFRADGSPWLISVAPRRVSYIELSVLERARLSHTAPGVASTLVNRGARDAVLSMLEHHLEERVDAMASDLVGYVEEIGDDHREVLCSSLESWLLSDDDVRAAVAVELVRRAGVVELRHALQAYADRLRAGAAIPSPLTGHDVLRDRWLSRRLRLVSDALDALPG